MAVRRATRTYDNILSFLKDYDATIKSGAVFLPADTISGELAAEIRLDFVLPIVGRAGPVKAQVVHRSPAGTALRIPSMSAEVQDLFDRFFAATEELREYFVATSDVVPRAEHEAALAAVREEMEAAVAEAKAAAERAAHDRAEVKAIRAAAASRTGGAPLPAAAVAEDAPKEPRAHGFPVPDLSGQEPAVTGSMQDRSF
ncbi:MAG: hypothetical protein ACI8S6_004073, partial [Myxococcota bacterium]